MFYTYLNLLKDSKHLCTLYKWAAGCLVQSQQPGAEHAQNCRDDSGLHEKLPHSPSWTALWLQWSHSGSWEPPSLRTWSGTLTLTVKRAQQRMYFLRQLKKLDLPHDHMTQFYSAVIKSVLCSSITVWFGSASKSDIRRLQRTIWTAERIIGVHLPSLQDLYNSRVKKWAGNIITDPSHPGHNLFALLPSGRRYRSLH